MKAEVSEDPISQQDLAKFDQNESKLQQIAALSTALVINGVDDKEGYEMAWQAKNRLVTLRNDIERKRVEIKEPHLRAGQAVDKYAKHLKAVIDPEEKRLAQMILEVDAEKERIEAERIRLEEFKYNSRKNALQGAECVFDDGMVYQEGVGVTTVEEMRDMSEEEFAVLYRHVLDEAEGIRAKRKKQEEALAELERLRQQQSPTNEEGSPQESVSEDKVLDIINKIAGPESYASKSYTKSNKELVIEAGRAMGIVVTKLEGDLQKEAIGILTELRQLVQKL